MSLSNCTPIVPEIFGGDNVGAVFGTGEILNDQSASGRERPWVSKKEVGLKLYKLLEIAKQQDEKIISDSMLENVRHCGEHLIFKQCPHHSGEKHLVSADFCRHRLCPMCNWRKSMKMFSQMSEIVEKMTDDNNDLRFIFLTLTVRNCEGDKLSEIIDRMNKAFALLTNKSQTFAIAKSVKKYILGYFKALEVTYSVQSDTYHPHLHVVLAVPNSYFTRGFTKTEKWVDIWQKCLGVDYKPIVHVESVDIADKGAICEITKYATKGEYLLNNISEEQAAGAVAVLAKALKGRRLVGYGGLFREIRRFLKQDDVESGDLIHVTGEQEADTCKICGSKLLEHMYKWRLGAYVN